MEDGARSLLPEQAGAVVCCLHVLLYTTTTMIMLQGRSLMQLWQGQQQPSAPPITLVARLVAPSLLGLFGAVCARQQTTAVCATCCLSIRIKAPTCFSCSGMPDTQVNR